MSGPITPFVSIHGRVFGLGPNGPMFMGRPVYNDEVGVVNTWYVSSAIAGLDGRSPATAMATLAAVTAKAAAGDKIVILEGHTETISAATTLTTVAGLRIVGLGRGSRRPTFTFDTATTAAFLITVDDISFTNCLFVANFLAVACPFSLSTAKNFSVTNCEFRDTSSVLNFINIVKSTGAANTVDGLTFSFNVVKNLGVTSNDSTIKSGNTIDRLTMVGNNLNWAIQNDKPIAINMAGGILTNLDCGYNKCYRPNTTTAGGSLITVTGTTSTGWVYNNYVQTLTTTTDLLFTTTVGLAAFNNYVTGAVGASGFLIPAADS